VIKEFDGKKPVIAATAFVSEAAHVIGEVQIGENSSVWPGAVVRGDFTSIAIGDNCQIEDGCVVHAGRSMTIGNNVHIGHGAVIHCLKIGDHVLIGSNATLLDGAVIGNGCVVAANCLVSERMQVPDDSFVAGVPAVAKGGTTAAQRAMIEAGVKGYVDLGRRYRERGL
jgi:carbonic anhydrase/acetyltransferase-like protein (isoleucine patch superfamily)